MKAIDRNIHYYAGDFFGGITAFKTFDLKVGDFLQAEIKRMVAAPTTRFHKYVERTIEKSFGDYVHYSNEGNRNVVSVPYQFAMILKFLDSGRTYWNEKTSDIKIDGFIPCVNRINLNYVQYENLRNHYTYSFHIPEKYFRIVSEYRKTESGVGHDVQLFIDRRLHDVCGRVWESLCSPCDGGFSNEFFIDLLLNDFTYIEMGGKTYYQVGRGNSEIPLKDRYHKPIYAIVDVNVESVVGAW